MKLTTHQKEYALHLLMQANSLNDLLTILKGISEKINIDEKTKRIKQYKSFRFMFFGLMVKVTGLLEKMLFRCEYLQRQLPEFVTIYEQFQQLQHTLWKSYNHIQDNQIIDGKNLLIQAAEQYEELFEHIQKTTYKTIGIR